LFLHLNAVTNFYIQYVSIFLLDGAFEIVPDLNKIINSYKIELISFRGVLHNRKYYSMTPGFKKPACPAEGGGWSRR
jgi:hypothetical protein